MAHPRSSILWASPSATPRGVAVHNIGFGEAADGGGVLNGMAYNPLQVALAHTPSLTLIGLGTTEAAPLLAYFQTDMQSTINQRAAGGSDVVLIGEPPTGVGAGTRPSPLYLQWSTPWRTQTTLP